jgi:hypothetical protein
VIWLETLNPNIPPPKAEPSLAALKSRLETYGLRDGLALCSRTSKPLPEALSDGVLGLDDAVDADLMVNMAYFEVPQRIAKRFRRSVFVDVDPGLTQLWMSDGVMRIARHDVYLTIGETVGQPGARFPDVGIRWVYTPPCVALEWWPAVSRPKEDASFTTVSQWHSGEWVVQNGGPPYANGKRDAFLPYVDLPRHTRQPLELALNLDGDQRELKNLLQHGWRVREAHDVSATPWEYQRYLQGSLGEFSCAKPSCVRLQNAWVSDRTICYLASGKPAVVQHTGPSRFLPDSAGMFRFRTMEEAARYLEAAAGDYDRQCGLARALAEEYFDAKRNLARVLEHTLA